VVPPRCAFLALALLSSPAYAAMTVQSLSGPVTVSEISSFKTFMQAQSPPTTNTYDNNMADGTAGMNAEALGLTYQVTNDIVLLNQMIQYADAFLALRNDTNTGQIMWDGNRDPVWLTKATNSSQVGYAGCENNDIVGHIAFCAKLILQSPALWASNVSVGDPHGYGTTYYQRAQTYLAQMDFTQDAYMLKWFINPANNQIVAPTDAAWLAENESVNAYNRQMMFLNGFQRLSECHQLLGDNPARVAKYDAIVTASVNMLVSGLQPYTTNGVPVCNWTYAPGSGGSEDLTLHSTYDIWGITRAWESGRYSLSNATLVPFANTLQYVINVSTNHVSYYVNGTSSPNSPRNFIYPGWMPIACFGPCTFAIMANMDIAQGSQGSTAIFDAMILWVKNARYLGVYPGNCGSSDFFVSTPWMRNLVAGFTTTCSITVNSLGEFTGQVALGAAHLPPGTTAAFSPATVTGGSGVSTLTLTTTASAPAGIYNFSVYATNNGTIRSTTVTAVLRSPPVIRSISKTGTNLVVSGTNGLPFSSYSVLTSTNLGSGSNWTPLATNTFDGTGHFNFTNVVSASVPNLFYLLRSP
jgi:hypothetical protein